MILEIERCLVHFRCHSVSYTVSDTLSSNLRIHLICVYDIDSCPSLIYILHSKPSSKLVAFDISLVLTR